MKMRGYPSRGSVARFKISLTWRDSFILLLGLGIGTIGRDIYESGNSPQPMPLMREDRIEACFTPYQKCAPQIIQYISLAQNEIQMCAYAFTSQPIADALVQAHKRGVKVSILCDAQQAQHPHSMIPQIKQAGIVVQSENVRGIAHNKVVIVDARLLITGSYNFTQGAENWNAENLLFLSHPETVQQYLDDWKRAWDNVKIKS